MSSRWNDDHATKTARKLEKEGKQRRRLEKQEKLEIAIGERACREREQAVADAHTTEHRHSNKRQKPESSIGIQVGQQDASSFFTFPPLSWEPCRHVSLFKTLNPIEEGSYGWVSRAIDTSTQQVVALKKLKMDHAPIDGFPVTALREIQTLKDARGHKHVVELQEVVVGEANSDLTGFDVYLVMEFLEHDLKTLQEEMAAPFTISEVKTLTLQISDALAFLHSNWILHRDLKTSNILLNNRGAIKIADFGMARFFGDPPPQNMTQLVVTLWYRAPELLLGTDIYDESIDVWSLGCVLGELVRNAPILTGRNEVDQLAKTFALCGIPTTKSWPAFTHLPSVRSLRLPTIIDPVRTRSKIEGNFSQLSGHGISLLEDLLSLDPCKRPDAKEVMNHPWFSEKPVPKSAAMFPTFPSKAGQERRRQADTPHAPARGHEAPKLAATDWADVFR